MGPNTPPSDNKETLTTPTAIVVYDDETRFINVHSPLTSPFRAARTQMLAMIVATTYGHAHAEPVEALGSKPNDPWYNRHRGPHRDQHKRKKR